MKPSDLVAIYKQAQDKPMILINLAQTHQCTVADIGELLGYNGLASLNRGMEIAVAEKLAQHGVEDCEIARQLRLPTETVRKFDLHHHEANEKGPDCVATAEQGQDQEKQCQYTRPREESQE